MMHKSDDVNMLLTIFRFVDLLMYNIRFVCISI